MSLAPDARRVTGVEAHRLGGFEDRSYRLRYVVHTQDRRGRAHVVHLRGSSERNDDTRRQAYVIMKYLWLHGFRAGPFRVARPVTFFDRWHLLIYEEAAGHPLHHLLRQHPHRATTYLRQAAAWLARLHQLAPPVLARVNGQRRRQRYWLNALDLLSSMPTREVAAMRRSIQQIMRFENKLAISPQRTLVHHDFHPGNLIFGQDAIRVVDFTDSRLSHPVVDVATFVTQLELQLSGMVPPAVLERWQKTFLSAYRVLRPSLRLKSAASQRVFRFIRYRIAVQSYLGNYLLGRREGQLKETIMTHHWYYA